MQKKRNMKKEQEESLSSYLQMLQQFSRLQWCLSAEKNKFTSFDSFV